MSAPRVEDGLSGRVVASVALPGAAAVAALATGDGLLIGFFLAAVVGHSLSGSV
jgi:hypothetical protein